MNIILRILIFSTLFTACSHAQEEDKTTLNVLFGDSFDQLNTLNPAFSIDIGSRFIAKTTKENLQNANSINDIIPEISGQQNRLFKQVETVIITGEKEVVEYGRSHELNTSQRELLHTADYGTNFYIRGDYADKLSFNNHLIYYISVVPEQEATYISGRESLINYLHDNISSLISHIDAKTLQPGRLLFEISSDGTLSYAEIESTCGFSDIDSHVLKLMKEVPGKWNPAKNAEGKSVAQQFVIFFGTQGC